MKLLKYKFGKFMDTKAVITIIDTGYDYKKEIGRLAEMGISAEYVPLEATNDRDLIEKTVRGKQIVLAGPELWDAEMLSRAKDLRMIARLGAGIEKIDLEAASKLGIAVANTPGANACSVAQFTVSMMLNIGLSVSRYDRNMRAGDFSRKLSSVDLMGKTVGLVGFGNIGRNVAKMLKGFDVKILAFVRHPDEKLAEEYGVTFTDLDTLIAESDYISLHLPLTDATKGMVDKDFFRRMKNTAFLINTCRGGVVEEQDLIEALRTGEIAGAGLDVYAESPLSAENPLLHMENVIHTPYVAFSSDLGTECTINMALESISDFMNGREIRRILNPDYKNAII